VAVGVPGEDRVSVGLLGEVFSSEVIDAAVDAAGVREQRDRKPPGPRGSTRAVSVSCPYSTPSDVPS
jgi:Insertion element 4 transposase N-terminal